MQANSIIAKMSRVLISRVHRKIQIGLTSFLMMFAIIHNAYAIPAQIPLFQLNSVKPIMMLNMSKDHQMYFKVYDDYSDITNPSGGAPDGKPDTTFNPKYEYYGYFDGKKCYQYVKADYFEPVAFASLPDHYCTVGSNQWSGNFLNWATMTRIDAIRKILFGGFRSTDTSILTILERAFIPQDAHAFAKFYDGKDINQLTPFTVPYSATTPATGITICNVTPTDALNDLSQNNKNPPLIRVVKGNYSLWASNESRQCQWDGASNANVPANSGINANANAPIATSTDRLTASEKYNIGEYVARVRVCAPNFLEKDECKQYSNSSSAPKPIGLFQEFGETDKIQFGLLTGSYGKNKSGGVLRKTIGNMSSEIDSTSGIFTGTAGAVSVLNSLRIYGYSYSASNYGPGDKCPFGITAYDNGSCSNWGNPQAEMYLESLRYLSSRGLSPDPLFKVIGTDRITNFTSALWPSEYPKPQPPQPLTSDNYCAPLNVLQFNASSSTFDDDELSSAADIGITGGANGVKTWTDTVGDSSHQNLSGSYFAGSKTGGTAAERDGMCTGKSFNGLSLFTGSCPDAPRLGGSYSIAGLAYYARTNDLNPTLKDTQFVRTLGVSLAPAVPSIKIQVPGTSASNPKYIQVLPACKNNRKSTVGPNVPDREGNCSIVDFKIVNTNIAEGNAINTAKLYVNWEVAESGNDYDQDMWGTIDISVTSTNVSVSTRIINMSASPEIGFGYVISGTDKQDGFKAASGGYNFVDANTWCNVAGRCNCVSGPCTQIKTERINGKDVHVPEVFPVASSATTGATFLPSALELAARWGGYSSSFEKKTRDDAVKANKNADEELTKAIKARDISDSYYFATDPRALAASLRAAFNDIAAGVGAATSVATVSAKVGEGDFVYQAQFNSQNWSGALQAYAFDNKGLLKTVPGLCSANVLDPAQQTVACTGAMPSDSSKRNILFNNSGLLTAFSWDNLSKAQQTSLKLASETSTAEAVKRADWLSGNATYETTSKDGILRDRGIGSNRNILGDIVNSSPVYVGDRNFKYNNLPNDAGAKYLKFVEDKKAMEKLLVVGSNDGMLHAFDATNFAEKFAFIPNSAFPKLAKLTMPDYGTSTNPHSYIVDGPLTYSDAYINGSWRRVVAGTMGAGGKGVFALDVTGSTPKLLFEITNADFPALGYVLGKPTILPMKNGRWAVVFGNGYDSGSTSRLFIVDLEEPTNSTYTKVLDAGEGTGLSTPAIEINGNGEAINVYAGDLNGNLWRFNLEGTLAGSWQKSYKLFKAMNAGVEQPITGSPTLGINSSKDWKTMVYFGTGKYFDVGDEGTNIGAQAFYAIADIGSTVQISTLLKKTMVTTGTTKRELSPKNLNPNWATQNGWYLLFDDITNAKGERVTAKPLLLFDKLIFQTLIPSTNACDNGGASWLMEVPAVGDKYTDKMLLNPNEYNPLSLGDLSFIANISTGEGSIISNPSTSKSTPDQTVVPLPTSLGGRQSWHQVQ
jgi:type IV pilus assembly protein PilY1